MPSPSAPSDDASPSHTPLSPLIRDLPGRRIHLVGVKGVGMTALAEILIHRGALLSGSDSAEVFFTDAILKQLGLPVAEGFRAENLAPGVELVIHSAAYSSDQNPELRLAQERGVPCLTYPAALGQLSLLFDAAGICGVHGKTTTTAMAGMILKELNAPATVLVGSEVPGFGHRSTHLGGDRFLVAETCEYKRHFLHFHPSRLVLTSIDEDHQDYFRGIDDIFDAFTTYALSLAARGALVYCADDPGVREIALRVREHRPDILCLPYGFTASGDYRITDMTVEPGTTRFRLQGFDHDFTMHVPGRHSVLNAVAALALSGEIRRAFKGATSPSDEEAMRRALEGFGGTRRRSEIIGEAGGILFMDDYAHHPTAIRTTIAGLREYHPHRRLVVDFMPHLYSRTRALLNDFAGSFSRADEVILHKIYGSAREQNDGRVTGRSLFELVRPRLKAAHYFEEPAEAAPFLRERLRAGDLFLTMGAGDNWKLGRELYRYFSETRSVP